MTENLYALGDIGATNFRIGIFNDNGMQRIGMQGLTDPQDYEGSVQRIADQVDAISSRAGGIVAASAAVAAEVNRTGVLVKSGALSPWLGKNLGADLATALDLPAERVGTPNDVVAIALSQQAINLQNNRPVDGVAATLSSGFNDALYFGGRRGTGLTRSDEAGHEMLRPGSICTCGQDGHVEAYVSGKGIELNHGMNMKDWLSSDLGNADFLVADLTLSTVDMLNRHSSSGFVAEELRWTGGVALNQPFIIERVTEGIRQHLGSEAPSVDTITMGHYAGLHGTLVDAQARANQ